MTKQNIIPRRLEKCNIPNCSSGLFARATHQQWISKRQKNWNKDNTDTKLGDLIYVDQMVSPKPGFIGQLTGILTRKIYKYAKLFEDQYSGLGYVYLQKTDTADETIQAKKSFEAYCNQRGVAAVRDYRADNGLFKDHKWVDECSNNEQKLTFSGVNAITQMGWLRD